MSEVSVHIVVRESTRERLREAKESLHLGWDSYLLSFLASERPAPPDEVDDLLKQLNEKEREIRALKEKNGVVK